MEQKQFENSNDLAIDKTLILKQLQGLVLFYLYKLFKREKDLKYC